MRRPQLAGLNAVTDQNARPQIAPDEGQQSLVAHLSGHAGHQDVVIDVVEELRQVEIDRDAIAGLEVGLHLLECAVGGTSGSKPVARCRKFRIEDRRHDLSDGLLHDPIHDGRDAQRAFAAAGLGDGLASHRLRLIAAFAQGLADGRPVFAGIGRKVFEAHTIGSRCTPVGLHATPCPLQVGRRENCFHQVVVQGWLSETTPIPGSPGRAQRQVRVTHGSSLSVHVRPFVSPRGDSRMASADF